MLERQKSRWPKLPEPKQHQKAECDEAPQYDAISPLLGPDPRHQTVDARDLARRTDYPPLHARQRLSLHPEVLVDGVGLAQHRVGDIVRVVDATPLVEHVVCLGVGGAVLVDVVSDVGEEVGAVARIGDGRLYAGQLAAVVGQDLAVAGEVVELDGRGRGFRVEQSR